MNDNSLDEAIGEIDDFVEAGKKNEMIVVFNNNLEALDWLDDEDAVDHKVGRYFRDIVKHDGASK
jgi:hypothetical protein